MTAVLATLPERLRRAADRLWRHSSEATDEVTETLTVSYQVLRRVCGDPESIAVAGDLLSTVVAAEIGAARGAIDTAGPQVTRAWQGTGAESFGEYLPRLSATLAAVEDGARDTAEAVALFGSGVASLYAAVVERTEATDAEVAATVAATRQTPHEAVGPVIDLVAEYSEYVEELATALVNLTSDSHPAGQRLALAAELPAGITDGHRLPRLDLAGDFHPAHDQVALDTAAMARLTSCLSDTGGHWARAGDSAASAAERLTPESLGLAGSHFCDDVHSVLERDRGLYATVTGQLDDLALGLRRVSSAYVTADDEIAAELRRGLEGPDADR